MIRKPTRREILKYAGVGILTFGVPLFLKVREASATIAYVRSGTASTGTGEISVSISDTSSGNGLIVFAMGSPVGSFSNPTVGGVSPDDSSIGSYGALSQTQGIFLIKNLPSGGTKTFTTSGNSYTQWMAQIIEISGQNTTANFDDKNTGQGSSGTYGDAPLTTTVNNCAMFSQMGIYNYHSGTPLNGDYTIVPIGNLSNPAATVTAQYYADAGASGGPKTNYMYTGGNEAWLMTSAAVRPAGAAPAARTRRGRIL